MPVKPDAKHVLVRLGIYKPDNGLTEKAMAALDGLRPDGLCVLLEAELDGSSVYIDGSKIESKKFARYMDGCRHALVMVSTLGKKVTDRIAFELENGMADHAVMLDAAASIAADEGLSFMTRAEAAVLIKKQFAPLKRRFSPGYGDLDIRYQKTLFDMLGAESLGLELTEAFMLKPEKSVIAVCGVKNLTGAENE